MNNLEQFENMTIGQLKKLHEQNKDLQRKIDFLQGNTKAKHKKSTTIAENLNMEHYIDEMNAKERLK